MHCYITITPVGDLGQTNNLTLMKKNEYNAPAVKTLAIKVEAGL